MTAVLSRVRDVPTRPALLGRPLLGQAARFLVVGGLATVVDVAAFNVLHVALGVGPLTAKVASTVLGGTVAFLGNRQWSFDGASDRPVRRQVVAFVLVSLAALGLALLPLAVARYVLGLTGVLALNLAGNVVGLVLATAFRFWGCRRFVFAAPEPGEAYVPARAYEPDRVAA